MPRPWPGSTRATTLALSAAIALSSGVSCAGTPLAPSGGRWVHPSIGYAVDAPAVSPQAWRAIRVDGADLAYRRSDGSTLTLMSDCARGDAPPALLARQLLIGTPEREVVRSEAVALAGAPGWFLVFQTREEGTEVTVNALTLASDGCTFDWLWVAPGRPEVAPWFERWWGSFVPPSGRT